MSPALPQLSLLILFVEVSTSVLLLQLLKIILMFLLLTVDAAADAIIAADVNPMPHEDGVA